MFSAASEIRAHSTNDNGWGGKWAKTIFNLLIAVAQKMLSNERNSEKKSEKTAQARTINMWTKDR